MGGMPDNQVRRTMQNRREFNSVIDSRFGTRRAKKPTRRAGRQVPEQAPD